METGGPRSPCEMMGSAVTFPTPEQASGPKINRQTETSAQQQPSTQIIARNY